MPLLARRTEGIPDFRSAVNSILASLALGVSAFGSDFARRTLCYAPYLGRRLAPLRLVFGSVPILDIWYHRHFLTIWLAFLGFGRAFLIFIFAVYGGKLVLPR